MGRLWAAVLLVCLLALPASAAPPDPNYVLVFHDTFSGTAIDTSKWQVTFDGNPDRTYDTYSNAYFWPTTNAVVANNRLYLSVTKVGNEYRTAALTTRALYTFGYWEARIRAPAKAKGVGANFWSNSYGWVFPEIDTFEWSGTNASQYRANFHDGSTWVSSNILTTITPGSWHVVGMEWTADSITWFLDGVAKKTIAIPPSWEPQPQWTLIGATVGPFGNPVDSTTVFPAVYQIDYVRIYQLP